MPNHIANIIGKLDALRPRPSRLLVQVPAGLKARALEVVKALEANGFQAFLAADDCFGACDLPMPTVAALKSAGEKIDAILHVGHAPFYVPIKTDIPLVHYEWPVDSPIDEKKLTGEISKIKEKRIGIVSSVQYLHALPKIAEIFRVAGKSTEIGGYVLGCWAKSAEALLGKVDALLFVGSGMFHPRGFRCDYFLDMERSEIRDVRSDIAKWEKIRWARIARAKDGRTFAILVSTKPGQMNMARALEIKAALERKDKKAFIVVMDKITDAALAGISADAFINTACPRLMDDRWSKPFVNAADVEKLLEQAS
ncbi:MAG: diphthamide biosynthesis enzyme Dph2 [Candidatus Aenigmatarchaeota archaeon]